MIVKGKRQPSEPHVPPFLKVGHAFPQGPIIPAAPRSSENGGRVGAPETQHLEPRGGGSGETDVATSICSTWPLPARPPGDGQARIFPAGHLLSLAEMA